MSVLDGGMTEALKNAVRCAECRHYDPSPFPGYEGKLALCKGPSWLYKVGHKTVAGRSCFSGKDDDPERIQR